LVGGSEALFGVKALFKMGPFSLTTLASQKKGEVKEVSVSGGSTSQEFTVRAYEYSTNHYFLDTIYASPGA
jgi:cell surface protein SprA